MKLFKKGDIVKVYSLQSFHGGGFINGTQGIVYQDQLEENDSVLVSVERKNEKGKDSIDHSYEVYAGQRYSKTPCQETDPGSVRKTSRFTDQCHDGTMPQGT